MLNYSLRRYLLIHQRPNYSQCVKYQPIHILFFPSWLMRPSTPPGWTHRVPWVAPGFGDVCPAVLCVPAPRVPVVLGPAVVAANARVSHAASPRGSQQTGNVVL